MSIASGPRQMPLAPHAATLEVTNAIPEEVEVASEVTVIVRVVCAEGCQLGDMQVDLVAAHGAVIAQALTDTEDSTARFVVAAPERVGEFVWSAVLVTREGEDGASHEAAPVRMSFRTRPHRTTLAVWDGPSPATVDSVVTMKVGLRCAAACDMAGQAVAILDETGNTIAEGILGSEPWAGTRALYWTEVAFTTRATEGVAKYAAIGRTGDRRLPHEDAVAAFTLRTTGRPEHEVVVKVVEKESGAGLSDIEVRLGSYRRSTNQHGLARVAVPTGTFELSIRKDGFVAPPVVLDVAGDLSVQVDATSVPRMAEIVDRLPALHDGLWG